MHESKTIDFNQVQPKPKQRKPIDLIPKSVNQEKYILSLMDDEVDIVVVSGPAGTGKTYLAMIAAIKALRERKVDRIVLSRPMVGADDEKIGFLPGDVNQKMEPWVLPMIDVLREYYSVKEIAQMLDEQVIEIAPLAFIRGRTFKHSWIIVDECQNVTPNVMKAILTRIGVGSKIVITGDTEQADRKTPQNGLLDLTERLHQTQVPGMVTCKFDLRDVQRHRIIEHVLRMYS